MLLEVVIINQINFAECGRETSRPCDIQCLTCKNVEISTGFSKGKKLAVGQTAYR
jgi:hypothetical protein